MPDTSHIPKTGQWAPVKYVSSAPKEAEAPAIMVRGSFNIMLTGTGKNQVFKGVSLLPLIKGGIVMMNVAEDFASLGQVSDLTAYGNVFNVYSALMYIGKGLLRLSGEQIADLRPEPPPHPPYVTATEVLSILIKKNGSYTDPESGPWQAGLAQPSSPTIRAVDPPAGFTGKVNGVVSVVIWRIRSTTGAVSIHSEVSNIVQAINQSIAIPLPLPDFNGQDYWGIGVTLNQEGTTGSHFELIEIPEAFVGQSLTTSAVSTTAGSQVITVPTPTPPPDGFTPAMIGWPVTLSGGSPAVTLDTYVIEVPSNVSLKLAAPVPTTSTGVHMTASRGVEGTDRTIVVEWRDGDLVGKPLAPFRDFSPPTGLFAYSLQDITFVDGSYGQDGLTTASNKGTAIAPSEFGKPESFSPDTVIFTNDTPVGLIPGDEVCWRPCKNGLYVLRYLQGLSVEPVWQNIGCDYQHNCVLGEGGRFYMWPTKRGPVRMDNQGMADGSFANNIADDLIGCTDSAKRILGWYDDLHVVCFCYEKKIWPWFADLEEWGAPADLSDPVKGIAGNIRACVSANVDFGGVIHRQLLISDDQDNLYLYDVGNGSVGRIRTCWIGAQDSMTNIALVVASVRADNTVKPVTIKIFADGDETTPLDSFDLLPSRVGYQRLPAVWPNVQDCESHAIEITIESTTSTGDCGLESVASFGQGHEMFR